MDIQKAGLFLAALRKESGLTQGELGERVGVTNKTVSRWETGTYLPPAESLEMLSSIYGITINEILSGQRLDTSQYQQKAEENIAAVMMRGNFTKQEKLHLLGEWLSKKWWLVLICLSPALLSFSLAPFATSAHMEALLCAISFLFVGIVLIYNHLTSHFAKSAYALTKDTKEFQTLKIMRLIWLLLFGISLFICIELGLSTLYAMTPEGTSDGYAITSMFYGILIPEHGNYLNNCWRTLKCALWQCFATVVVIIDLNMLRMEQR